MTDQAPAHGFTGERRGPDGSRHWYRDGHPHCAVPLAPPGGARARETKRGYDEA